MFEFKMNDRVWHIVEVDQESFWKDSGEENKIGTPEYCNTYHFGRCIFKEQEIWLWKDVSQEQKRKTLIHELLHCYRGCYVTFNDINCDEDFWCDMCANSHDIIHDIVERYFERKTINSEQIKEYFDSKIEKSNDYEVMA